MKPRKLILIVSVFALTMLSIEPLSFSFINEASAAIRLFSNENGDKEMCIVSKPETLKANLEIKLDAKGGGVVGGGFEMINRFWKGSQDACEDASILYACRQHCAVSDYTPISG